MLDIERIFGSKQESAEPANADVPAKEVSSKIAIQTAQKSAAQKVAETKAAVAAPAKAAEPKPEPKKEKVDYSFIITGLSSMRKFNVTGLNEKWVESRYSDWESERGSDKTQLQTPDDADAFLKGFYSPCSGTWWKKDYADAVCKALPDNSAKQIVVWNLGCGKGFETYSFACILKSAIQMLK